MVILKENKFKWRGCIVMVVFSLIVYIQHSFAQDKRHLVIGDVAPDFIQPDTTGKAVRLSDFRGSYVLLDFWASWCSPCRAENPALLHVFNTYKNKSFTILAVSLDSQNGREKWINAIEQDRLVWHQLSDLQGWKNSAAVLYQVRYIPQNYLISPSGHIVAINLHGAALADKLKELL